jgi:hypothetical protein
MPGVTRFSEPVPAWSEPTLAERTLTPQPGRGADPERLQTLILAAAGAR